MRRLLVAVALVVLAACGNDDEPSSTSTTVATGPTGTHATTSTSFPGATTPVSTPPSGGVRELKAVRAGTHEGFDRVAFEFTGAVPGYSVKYIERPVVADASGEEVSVGGGAVLEVRFEPATAHDSAQRCCGAGDVVEVVKTGDFEAVVHFAIGVKGKAPFHAFTTEGNKLVIDIAHAA